MVFIPVRSGSNCILFTDLNMTPQFQKWQYSNCFEKSWLSFWMISKYHHPPHSTQPLVYFQWSAITNAFCSVSREAYLELFHHCQTYRRLFSMAPDEQSCLFLGCNQRDKYWVWRDPHPFSNNILFDLVCINNMSYQ